MCRHTVISVSRARAEEPDRHPTVSPARPQVGDHTCLQPRRVDRCQRTGVQRRRALTQHLSAGEPTDYAARSDRVPAPTCSFEERWYASVFERLDTATQRALDDLLTTGAADNDTDATARDASIGLNELKADAEAIGVESYLSDSPVVQGTYADSDASRRRYRHPGLSHDFNVLANNHVAWTGRVEAHDRAYGWTALLRQLADIAEGIRGQPH